MADVIRDNDVLRNVSKIMITPLLIILKTGSIAGDNSELGVIASGILSNMLIGAVYVTPLSIGSLLALKKSVKKHYVKHIVMAWTIALALTLLGSILYIDMFMMASAGILVLSSIVLATTGLTVVFNRLCHHH